MIIEKLSPSPDRAGRYVIRFDDGSVLRLYRQTVEDFGIYTGKELTDVEFHQLQLAAGKMSAKMRAVRIVAASGVSKIDLQHRLIQKGETPESAKDAVEWMEQLDLIDDRKTAQQVVGCCIRKGYGIARAKQALYEKRLPRELWEEALSDYPDQTEYIRFFLTEKLPSEPEQRDVRRAIDALIRRGHPYSHIRRCLEQLRVDTEDLPEE